MKALIYVTAVILFFTLSNACKVDPEFYFNLNPKDVSVREGSPAFLECNVSNACGVRFHWAMGDETVANTSRRYQNGSNLVIAKVNKTLDDGEFKCVATVTSGLSKESKGATLSIQWITDNVSVVLFDETSVDSTVQRLTLNCNANGTEELTTKLWFLNGRRITKNQSSKYFIDPTRRTLTLKDPGPTENGVYSCQAENSAGAVWSRQNYLLARPYEGLPRLVKSPQNAVVKSGSKIIFDCMFDAQKNLTWKKSNDESFRTDSIGRFKQLINGSLLIDPVKTSDAGTYECRTYGKNGAYHGYAATLNIAYLNDFSTKNFVPANVDYFVRRQQQLEISCMAPEGNPAPKIHWERDGAKMVNSHRISTTEDVRLIISHMEEADQGQYRCVAENLAGSKFGSINVFVTSVPIITHHPASLEVKEDDFVQFDCKFSGDPYPITSVEWKKMGKILKPNDLDKRTKIYPENGTLTIERVTPSADDGHYDCVVRTRGQEAVVSRQATLKVKLKLKFAPKPVDKKLMFGANAQIPCVAVGFFLPTVRWFKRNDPPSSTGINLKNGFPPHVREKNGVLYFNSVKFEDAGYYTCTASSSQGYINETIKVSVYIFPTIVQGPVNSTQIVGSNAIFHCFVTGQPKPRVEWYFEGNAESSKWPFPYTKYDNHSILIKDVTLKHAGRYGCMAGNNAGFKRQEAVLCIRAPNDHFAQCGAQVGLVAQRSGYNSPFSHEDHFKNSLPRAKGPGSSDDARLPSSNAPPLGANGAGGLDSADSGSRAAVTAGVVGVYFAAVVALAAGCGLRLRRRRRQKNVGGQNGNEAAPGNPHVDAVAFQCRVGGEFGDVKRNVGVASDNEEDRVLLGGEIGRPQYIASDLNGPASHTLPLLSPAPCSSYALAVMQQQRSPASCYDDEFASTALSASAIAAPSSICDALRLKFQCSRSDLRVGGLLGTGRFGEVRLAKLTAQENSEHAHQELSVFVKICTKLNNEQVAENLNKELEMYSVLQHPNIVKFLAICQEAEPLLVVYEYLEYGNLKHYLIASQNYTENCAGAYPAPLAPSQIISIAHQVSKAMEYLTQHGFLHCDLAARNTLLSADFTAKIGHLTLEKDAFSQDYCNYRNLDLPLRWMAPEAIANGGVSVKSDVFAFSIFLWEMYTHGQVPYQPISDEQLIESVLNGQWTPPTVPHVVPERLANLMKNCTLRHADDRPSFVEIRRFFDQSVLEYDI